MDSDLQLLLAHSKLVKPHRLIINDRVDFYGFLFDSFVQFYDFFGRNFYDL